MCECEKRFEAMKETMKYILDDLCDLITSTTDENKDFYEGMFDQFELYKTKIEAI